MRSMGGSLPHRATDGPGATEEPQVRGGGRLRYRRCLSPGGPLELVDILVLVLVVAGGAAGYGAWRRQVLVRQLRADSPPGALVRPHDPLEVVEAKNRTWAML